MCARTCIEQRRHLSVESARTCKRVLQRHMTNRLRVNILSSPNTPSNSCDIVFIFFCDAAGDREMSPWSWQVSYGLCVAQWAEPSVEAAWVSVWGGGGVQTLRHIFV